MELFNNIRKRLFDHKLLDYKGEKIFLYRGIRHNACRKEPETVAWIENYIKEGDVFYDIGACVGSYSLLAGKIKKDIKIFAFEPSHNNFYVLAKNIFLNKLENTITPLVFPLDKKTSLTTFNYKSLKDGVGINKLGKTEYEPYFKRLTYSFTLDDLVDTLGYPHHMKIDTEGNEYNILLGGAKVLKSQKLKSMLIEIKKDAVEKMSEFLNNYGFKFKNYKIGKKEIGNSLFVR